MTTNYRCCKEIMHIPLSEEDQKLNLSRQADAWDFLGKDSEMQSMEIEM